MIQYLAKSIKQFCDPRKEKEGAAAVEFAFAGGLITLTVIAIVEILSVLLVNVLIEGGVREAARFGITGADGAAGREAQILQIVSDHTHGLVNMDNARIRTLVYDSFQAMGQPETFIDDSPANGVYDEGEYYDDINGNGVWDEDQGTPGMGTADDIVLYIVEYDLPTFTGNFSALYGHDGFGMRAAIPVRNEPYVIE